MSAAAAPTHEYRGGKRARLAKVHIAKKDLALDDDTYREVLHRVTKHASAADCTFQQLEKLLAEFRRLGWKVTNKRPPSTSARVRKVWALWGQMCREGTVRAEGRPAQRAALRAFVEKMTGVTDPEWLTPEQASQVIEGLKHWRARGAQ